MLALIGAALAIAGTWLAGLGGSVYYLIVGLAYLAAATLLFAGKLAGVWIVVAVAVLSSAWAWWETGSDFWVLIVAWN